jgi:hypothetical protein
VDEEGHRYAEATLFFHLASCAFLEAFTGKNLATGKLEISAEMAGMGTMANEDVFALTHYGDGDAA